MSLLHNRFIGVQDSPEVTTGIKDNQVHNGKIIGTETRMTDFGTKREYYLMKVVLDEPLPDENGEMLEFYYEKTYRNVPNKMIHNFIFSDQDCVFKEVYVKLDVPFKVRLEVGGQCFDRIDSEYIEILCDVYNIPFKKNGMMCIPMYYLIQGVPYLWYHHIKLRFEFKEEQEIFEIQYNKYEQNYDFIKKISENEDRIFLSYQTQKYEIDNNLKIEKSLCFNHPVYHFFVKGNHETLSLVFSDYDWKTKESTNEEKLVMHKTKQIGDISLFSFVKNFHDFDNTINFSRVDKCVVQNEDITEIVALSSQPVKYINGMGGLVFSK